MDFTIARGVADAVFYEGYLLYPYTATSHKNKMRWQFGIVVPKAHEAAGTGEHGHQQTDVLFEATGDACIEVIFRFLHVESRSVEASEGAIFVPVSSLTVDGIPYLTFDESIEREVTASSLFLPWAGHVFVLRAEVYNVFNRAQFGIPSSDLVSSNFGQITGTSINYIPRTFQFAARYVF